MNTKVCTQEEEGEDHIKQQQQQIKEVKDQLRLHSVVDKFLSLDPFSPDDVTIHTNVQTNQTTVILLGKELNETSARVMEDTAAKIANHYLYNLEVFDYANAGTLIVMLREEEEPPTTIEELTKWEQQE